MNNYILMPADELHKKDSSIVVDGVNQFIYSEKTWELLHEEGSGVYWYESSVSGETTEGDWFHMGNDGNHNFKSKVELVEYLEERYA